VGQHWQASICLTQAGIGIFECNRDFSPIGDLDERHASQVDSLHAICSVLPVGIFLGSPLFDSLQPETAV